MYKQATWKDSPRAAPRGRKFAWDRCPIPQRESEMYWTTSSGIEERSLGKEDLSHTGN